MSPRNSPEAVVNMLEKTNCHRIVVSPFVAPLVSAIQKILVSKNYEIKIDQLPTIRSVFPTLYPDAVDSEVSEYPASTKPSSPNDVTLILHSSGSTGFPKPIPQTNKTMLQWCQVRKSPSKSLFCSRSDLNSLFTAVVSAYRGLGIGQGGAMLPTFHTMGIFIQLYGPLATSEFVALYTPHEPAPPAVPNPQNLLEAIKVTGAMSAAVVPAFLEVGNLIFEGRFKLTAVGRLGRNHKTQFAT